MTWHLLQYKLQVIVGVGAIFPGCLDERIDDRVRFCTVDTCREQICPPSLGHRLQAALGISVVKGDIPILQEPAQVFFLVPCVHDSILHLIADTGSIYIKLFCKAEEGKDPGPYILPAPDLPFFGGQVPEQVLFMIDIPGSCGSQLLQEVPVSVPESVLSDPEG